MKLLNDAGCQVYVPVTQTCCGQPAYNAGDEKDARDIALQVMEDFEGLDYVVAPSGSCAGMIKIHYPRLFKNDPVLLKHAKDLASRTYELMSFLADIVKDPAIYGDYNGTATYHDSCSGLRELGVKAQPRDLMSQVPGLKLVEGAEAEACCGFGGLFCVKYPDISEKIVDAKVDDILATGADTVLGGDLGCLMNIAGRLTRRGSEVKVRHVAEVLAGTTGVVPPIGQKALRAKR
jgi:L-lactate dehydrogenase complex protein LldE